MRYSKTDDVSLFEIKGLSSAMLNSLREFLRMNMIVPVGKSGDGYDEDGGGYYNGAFSLGAAKQIEKWLQDRGIPRVSICRD